MSTKSNNQRATLVTIFFFLSIILSLVLYALFHGRIKQNPPGTVGNTAGNLNNTGLFCEHNGTVYFANAYDNGTLYSMNADETNVRKLSNAQVQYINAGGDYLYYYQSDTAREKDLGSITRSLGLYRFDTKGKKAACLKRNPCMYVTLVDNTLYYLYFGNKDGATLYQIDTDKKNEQETIDELVNPVCVQNGVIYYNGTADDHYLYSYDTATSASSLIWEGNLWNPVIWDDYVYYMDVSNNYRLCRRLLTSPGESADIEILTTDRIDMFNLSGDYIYYQKSSQTEPALKRMRIDGSENEIIAEGVYQNINITSYYVYFNEYGAPYPIYKTPVGGAPNVTEFTAARDAVTEHNP